MCVSNIYIYIRVVALRAFCGLCGGVCRLGPSWRTIGSARARVRDHSFITVHLQDNRGRQWWWYSHDEPTEIMKRKHKEK